MDFGGVAFFLELYSFFWQLWRLLIRKWSFNSLFIHSDCWDQKSMQLFLSLASNLNPDDNRSCRVMNELSFANGDWKQESMEYHWCHLMTLACPEAVIHFSAFALYLVSFQVTDVNPIHLLKNTVNLNGIMSFGISRNSSFGHNLRSNFYARPGIYFCPRNCLWRGLYWNWKEWRRPLFVFVGEFKSPYWDWFDDPSRVENSYCSNFNREPHLLQDDQTLLVLR